MDRGLHNLAAGFADRRMGTPWSAKLECKIGVQTPRSGRERKQDSPQLGELGKFCSERSRGGREVPGELVLIDSGGVGANFLSPAPSASRHSYEHAMECRI